MSVMMICPLPLAKPSITPFSVIDSLPSSVVVGEGLNETVYRTLYRTSHNREPRIEQHPVVHIARRLAKHHYQRRR